jgi:hypothetical protein
MIALVLALGPVPKNLGGQTLATKVRMQANSADSINGTASIDE